MKKRTIKLSRKLVKTLLELKENRSVVHGVTTKFIENVSHRVFAVDFLFKNYQTKLKRKKSEDAIILVSIGQYISSLVTCWETFFRDMIEFIISVDNEAYLRVINFFTGIGNGSFSESYLKKQGISIGDYFCKHFNLQHLDDLCNAFNIIFDKNYNNIFEYISETMSTPVYFTSPNYIMYLLQDQPNLIKNLYEEANEAFQLRHRFIHDSNYLFTYDPTKIMKYEHILVIFPQFIGVWLSNKYSQKRMVFNPNNRGIRLTDKKNPDEGSYIIGLKDIRGEWKVVDEKE